MKIAFIIPVYQREEELRELLESFSNLFVPKDLDWEIVIVDDGSDPPLEKTVQNFKLPIRYFHIPNSGPGYARNFGMKQSDADYFVILDSDVLLPEDYFLNLKKYLNQYPEMDMFGGPDDATESFTPFQKAVNLILTSPFTTGGIRGNRKSISKYVPRSFNMVVKGEVFFQTGGFGNIHPGEDPEWVYQAWRKGFKSTFLPDLKVFHKRRQNIQQFVKQMFKFGMARAYLNSKYPETLSPVYFFPLFFVIFFWVTIYFTIKGNVIFLYILTFYLLLFSIDSLIKGYSLQTIVLGIILFLLQMHSYTLGFLLGTFNNFLTLLGFHEEKVFKPIYMKSKYEKQA